MHWSIEKSHRSIGPARAEFTWMQITRFGLQSRYTYVDDKKIKKVKVHKVIEGDWEIWGGELHKAQ
ncbi:hypothetical protein IGI04_029629 [Brassica rapa subsp. trilocularis]|uniref:Uncharacterized protein n=1 Tax=Brassica rapa subsp. trilocularis TaxID=1813537 RepID=A0ABQ7LNE0_BRACM|nr:hypothetical protein IGI04_029629 [Brassica rapa subsp. trilocularis]